MQSIGVRELRQHASRYLACVKAGETVEVTERGHPIALLVPVEGPESGSTEAPPKESPYQRMLREGRIRPAAGDWRDLPMPAKLPPGSRMLSEILAEMRDEDDR